jgi:hypothetical protein
MSAESSAPVGAASEQFNGDSRSVLLKAMEKLEAEFFCNTNFTYYMKNRVVLHAMSDVLTRLPLAMSLYAKERASYIEMGPDCSQRIFMQHPDMAENYEAMWDEFKEYWEKNREFFVERVIVLRKLGIIPRHKFDFDDFLVVMQIDIDDEMKLMRKEVAKLREKVDAGGDTLDSEGDQSQSPQKSQGFQSQNCQESQGFVQLQNFQELAEVSQNFQELAEVSQNSLDEESQGFQLQNSQDPAEVSENPQESEDMGATAFFNL